MDEKEAEARPVMGTIFLVYIAKFNELYQYSTPTVHRANQTP